MPTAVRTKRKPPATAPGTGLPAAIIGRLTGRSAAGEPLVEFPGNPTPGPIAARATTPWTIADIGAEVALVFGDGSASLPIILGVIRTPVATPQVEVRADGERVLLEAGHQIELRCGKASITLTSAGKVLIRGEYVLSRSAGVNRVKGAAVEIN
jgi:Domain of unknown function (DUF6484)